jgi:hypothetical protein
MTLIERAITVFATLALLTSCAAIREYRAEYKAELAAEEARRAQPRPQSISYSIPDDPGLNLLLGLYAFSLVKTGKSAYMPYRYLSPYAFFPLWDLNYDLWRNLQDYQYQLQMINDMERFKLEMQMRFLMDELKREISKIKK